MYYYVIFILVFLFPSRKLYDLFAYNKLDIMPLRYRYYGKHPWLTRSDDFIIYSDVFKII